MMIPLDRKKQGAAVHVPVPPVLDPEQAYSLWMDIREPLTASEKRAFINAIRLGVIRGERARIRTIAEKLKADGKHEDACAFLLRLTGLPVVEESLCSEYCRGHEKRNSPYRKSARGRALTGSRTIRGRLTVKYAGIL